MAVVAGRRRATPSPRTGDAVRRRAERPRVRGSRGGPAAHFRYVVHLADGAALAVALPLAYLVKTRLLPAEMTPLYDPSAYVAPAALVASVTLFSLVRQAGRRPGELLRPAAALRSVAVAVGQGLLFGTGALYAFKLSWVSRLFVALYGASSATLLLVARVALGRSARRRGGLAAARSRVLVVGRGDEAERLERLLADGSAFGIDVVARVEPEGEAPPEEWLAREAIDEVAVASFPRAGVALGRLIEACEREGIALHILPDGLAPGLGRASLEPSGAGRILSLNPQQHSPWGRAVKRVFDLVAASSLLVLTAPLWIAVAVAIRLDSPGPVLFRQERIGLNKRRFSMLKFRSMVDGAESLTPLLRDLNEADGPVFKVRRDPRVTRVGRWLRRFDLDELPQLINVLRGEMSLIGPRPMLPSEIQEFEPWQRKRFSMAPGMTGLWQVQSRLDRSFLAGLRADLEYVDRWSLWLDLEILLRTIPAVLRDRVAP